MAVNTDYGVTLPAANRSAAFERAAWTSSSDEAEMHRVSTSQVCPHSYMGDTKAGTLIGTDLYGNKYFENHDELPRRCSP
ncbi:hypothetical protein ANO11243_048710 [Dothideomycetidae sp. 11243]|nr:hypothetical protein ANO11243_048710 [fungal sp. No.11243]